MQLIKGALDQSACPFAYLPMCMLFVCLPDWSPACLPACLHLQAPVCILVAVGNRLKEIGNRRLNMAARVAAGSMRLEGRAIRDMAAACIQSRNT